MRTHTHASAYYPGRKKRIEVNKMGTEIGKKMPQVATELSHASYIKTT